MQYHQYNPPFTEAEANKDNKLVKRQRLDETKKDITHAESSDSSQCNDRASRVQLVLSPQQLIDEGYPLPVANGNLHS